MIEKNKTPETEELEKELTSGITALKGLVSRKASETLITYQTKIIQGTLDDLIKAICGKREPSKTQEDEPK